VPRKRVREFGKTQRSDKCQKSCLEPLLSNLMTSDRASELSILFFRAFQFYIIVSRKKQDLLSCPLYLLNVSWSVRKNNV
jgi:hypothetical protein